MGRLWQGIRGLVRRVERRAGQGNVPGLFYLEFKFEYGQEWGRFSPAENRPLLLKQL